MGEEDKLPLFFDLDYGIYGSAENTLMHLSEDELQIPVYYTAGSLPWLQKKHVYEEPVHKSEIHTLRPPHSQKGRPGQAYTIVLIKRHNPPESMMKQVTDTVSQDNVRLRGEIERLQRELAAAKNQANVATTNMSKAISDMKRTIDPKSNNNSETQQFMTGGISLPSRRY